MGKLTAILSTMLISSTVFAGINTGEVPGSSASEVLKRSCYSSSVELINSTEPVRLVSYRNADSNESFYYQPKNGENISVEGIEASAVSFSDATTLKVEIHTSKYALIGRYNKKYTLSAQLDANDQCTDLRIEKVQGRLQSIFE